MRGWIDRRLLIGVGLQICAFLVGVASGWLLYSAGWLGVLLISAPMFIASPFFLMRSAAPLPVRLLMSFWILFIPAYHVATIVIEYTKVRTEVLLIPQGYRGLMALKFDEKTGAAAQEEEGKLVFRIGADGEGRTQAHEPRFSNRDPDESREQRREYYFVDAAGKRTRVARESTSTETGDRVVVFPTGDYFDKHGGISRVEWFVGTSTDQRNYYAELDHARRETFEIQKGLRGKVRILFDVPDGEPANGQGGDALFRIGPSGELRTQAHEPRLYYANIQRKRDAQREFYEWDGSGASQELKRPGPSGPKAVANDEPIVAGFQEYYGDNGVSRIEFFVGTPAELEKLRGPDDSGRPGSAR